MKTYTSILISLMLLTSCVGDTNIPTQKPNMSASGIILTLGDSLTIGY